MILPADLSSWSYPVKNDPVILPNRVRDSSRLCVLAVKTAHWIFGLGKGAQQNISANFTTGAASVV